MEKYMFRGKRTDDGEWIYGDCLHFNDTIVIIPHINIDKIDIEKLEVVPSTAGQYIGRKDRNGKRIYKGDIVKAKDVYSNLIENHPIPEFIGVVDFQDCSFVIENDYITAYRWMDYKVEVIGNIWDNHELLENIE